MKATAQLLKRLALLLGATTFLLSAWAQNQATLTPIGKWPEYPLLEGPTPAVRVAGSYAYVAGAGHLAPQPTLRLLVLDVSTPSQPRYVSHVDSPANWPWWDSASMEIGGGYAYVALNQEAEARDMLAVFSLSQPGAPQRVGTYLFAGNAHQMARVGNYLLVVGTASGVARVWILDISDPAHPVLRRTISGATSYYSYWSCISVGGNYAYVGGSIIDAPGGGRVASVSIIDVTDPSQAQVMGGFDLPGSEVAALAAQGPLLHVGRRFNQYAYEVYDLSDPLSPQFLASYDTTPESPQLIRVVGNLVYFLTARGLHIFDLTDRYNPHLKAFVPLEGSSLSTDSFDIASQFAYIHDGSELRVLDVQDPAAPFQVGQFDTGFYRMNAAGYLQVCVEGDLAYLLDLSARRLRVVNVSSPRAPALMGAKDDLGQELAGVSVGLSGFRVVGPRAYIAGQVRRSSGGVTVHSGFLKSLDVSDPAQPRDLGLLETFTQDAGVDVVGTRAYVAGTRSEYSATVTSEEHRLTILDVSNPAAMSEVGHVVLPDAYPGPPQVVGDFAYCRFYTGGPVIVDIHDPNSMVVVGSYPLNAGLSAFQVIGQYAYVLVSPPGESSLHVVDAADPVNPTRVGRYLWEVLPDNSYPELLHVSGRHAFVTFYRTNRVDILDVGDPTRPVKVGEYNSEGQVTGMALAGNTLYATSDTGLTVLGFFAPNTSPNLRLNAPVLSGGVAVLTWEGGPGIKLQKARSLTNPNWQEVPNTAGQSLIALPPTDAAAFFRLIQSGS